MERWKDVIGFEGRYEVSDLGRVRSLRWRDRHVLKPRSADRYEHVALGSAPAVERSVHVLVLEAFVGLRPEGMYGLHKDDNTRNNRLSNLRWGTPKENQDQRHAAGKRTRGPIMVPGDISRVLDLKRAGFGVVTISRYLGLNRNLVPRILLGEYHRYE